MSIKKLLKIALGTGLVMLDQSDRDRKRVRDRVSDHVDDLREFASDAYDTAADRVARASKALRNDDSSAAGTCLDSPPASELESASECLLPRKRATTLAQDWRKKHRNSAGTSGSAFRPQTCRPLETNRLVELAFGPASSRLLGFPARTSVLAGILFANLSAAGSVVPLSPLLMISPIVLPDSHFGSDWLL